MRTNQIAALARSYDSLTASAIDRYTNLNRPHGAADQSDLSFVLVGPRAQSWPNQENSPKSPDPFPSQRVGSGDETKCYNIIYTV